VMATVMKRTNKALLRRARSTPSLLPSGLLGPGLLVVAEPTAAAVTGWSAAVARADDVDYPLGTAGRCTGERRLFILVLDDSGSVTGVGGNDPLSRRYAEARLAVRTLSRACGCGRERVAVLHFDGLGEVEPCGLDRWGLVRVLDGLVQPVGAGGSSELGPALGRAEALAGEAAGHGYRVQLVVLSDFELLDDDPVGVMGRLAAFPGAVTAVVLGGSGSGSGGATSGSCSLLEALPADVPSTMHVLSVAAGDEPGALARALFGTLTVGRGGRRVVS
jgi:hypothetical protein